MSSSSTGTLVLATLLSIVGWLGVTLYNEMSSNRDGVHDLGVRVRTIEVTKYVPPTRPNDAILILGDSISKVAEDHAAFKEQARKELKELDARIDALVSAELSRERK